MDTKVQLAAEAAPEEKDEENQQGHNPKKCFENGQWDNDCCAVKGTGECIDNYKFVDSQDVCYDGGDWKAYRYLCIMNRNVKQKPPLKEGVSTFKKSEGSCILGHTKNKNGKKKNLKTFGNVKNAITCQNKCETIDSCTAVEYNSFNKKCEVWSDDTYRGNGKLTVNCWIKRDSQGKPIKAAQADVCGTQVLADLGPKLNDKNLPRYWADQAYQLTAQDRQAAYDRVLKEPLIERFAQFCKEIPLAEVCCITDAKKNDTTTSSVKPIQYRTIFDSSKVSKDLNVTKENVEMKDGTYNFKKGFI